MSHTPLTGSLPRIVVGEADESRLTALAKAAAMTSKTETVARTLLAEMERADIVRDSDLPPDAVRMGSTVVFEIDGRGRRVQVVYPGEADIDSGRISILTPIGTALIGLSPGQTISFQGHDGRTHELKVLSVEQSNAE